MIDGNKRTMYDEVSAKKFAEVFAGFYGYTVGEEVKTIRGDHDGRGCIHIVVPNADELEEFVNMVRQGEVPRTW